MWDAFRADEPDSPARSRRLARLADRLTGRDLTERYIIGLRAWDATLRGEPARDRRAARRARPGRRPRLGRGGPRLRGPRPGRPRLPVRRPARPGRGAVRRRASPTSSGRAGAAPISPSRTRCSRTSASAAAGSPRPRTSCAAGLRLAERVGPGTPAHWYAVGILIEILLARGRVAEAARTAEHYSFGAPFPPPSSSPTPRPCTANSCSRAGSPRTRPPNWPPQAAAWTRAACATPPGAPGSCTSRAPRPTTPPSARRHRPRSGPPAPADSAPPPPSARPCGSAAEVSSGSARLKLLEESVRHLERSPAAYELACALVALGAELRRTGRPKEAAEPLYRGLDAAVQCGADGLVERARDELAAAGLRPRPPAQHRDGHTHRARAHRRHLTVRGRAGRPDRRGAAHRRACRGAAAVRGLPEGGNGPCRPRGRAGRSWRAVIDPRAGGGFSRRVPLDRGAPSARSRLSSLRPLTPAR